jgi:4-aminobutyrate aminotransferase-like enzyme
MLGLELIEDKGAPASALAGSLIQRALQDGIILLADSPTSNVLSFSPPFVIDDEEIDFVVSWLRHQLTEPAAMMGT